MTRGSERSSKRCAIYTRKSTEDGLDQAFNSLDAQREACGAYIASQCHEGWTLVPDLYDDGGYSGGTMDRPGLAHLLADVKAGKVDVIVVYKVDRLTRSLADFAKIVEILDAHEASFVSITQAFNTTTSMGRLTLNVLLSFAQFEREVTGERIRDKIAASKARGLWMGGTVPLGYDVQDRKLVINDQDAAQVQMMFTRYLALGSVPALQAELAAADIRSKRRISRSGRRSGGAVFSKGALYLLLRNRIYLGEICHKGTAYPGEHAPIIDRVLFETVAARLDQNRRDHSNGSNFDAPSLLTGLVWDGEGRRMTPNHASKGGTRYRYYVSRLDPTASTAPAWRVPAGDLEAIILGQLRTITGDEAIITRLDVQRLIDRVTIRSDGVDLALVAQAEESQQIVSLPATLIRRGMETRLALPPDATTTRHRDPALIKLLVKAWAAREALAQAGDKSVAELATQQGYSRDYFGVLLRIAYLAPDIVVAILEGRQPVQLNRQRLARATNLPIDWQGQREMLGFG